MPLTFTFEGGSVAYADPVDGFTQGSAAKYWLRKPTGEEQYAIERSSAPSNDGFLTSRHGYRGTPLGPFKVMYINTSEANCIAAFVADRNDLRNKKVSIAVPGWASPHPNCSVRLKPSNPKQSGTSLYRMEVEISAFQDRLT